MLGSGSTHIAVGATMNLGTPNAGAPTLAGRKIDNDGLVVWPAGLGSLTWTSGQFNNAAQFDVQLGDVALAGGALFNNTGTLLKSAGNGPLTIGCPFNQAGLLRISAGSVDFSNDLTQPDGGQIDLDGGDLSVEVTSRSRRGRA
jgi:hypothetical protein